MQVHFETERLWLCAWETDDLAAARHVFTDPNVMRYINGGKPRSDNEIRKSIERQQNHLRSHGFCLWKLIQKSDGRLIGDCGLQPLELDGASEIEIGWRLARDYWGRGFATEAALVALHHAVEHAHLTRVIAIAMSENLVSLRIMKKLGMAYERPSQKDGFAIVVYSRHFAAEAERV